MNTIDSTFPITSYCPDIDLPAWITDREITLDDIDAICQGGCASGAYMPAVTYYDASVTMGEHGDDVLDYIDSAMGELPSIGGQSWSQMACTYLSAAVEIWASSVQEDAQRALDDLATED